MPKNLFFSAGMRLNLSPQGVLNLLSKKMLLKAFFQSGVTTEGLLNFPFMMSTFYLISYIHNSRQ